MLRRLVSAGCRKASGERRRLLADGSSSSCAHPAASPWPWPWRRLSSPGSTCTVPGVIDPDRSNSDGIGGGGPSLYGNGRRFHSSADAWGPAAAPAASRVVKKTRKPASGRGRGGGRKRRPAATKAGAGASSQLEEEPHQYVAEAGGRPIMTEERLDEIVKSSGLAVSYPQLARVLSDQAKNLVHNAQRKMLFRQRYEHVARGSGNDALFYATLRTTFDKQCFSELPSSASDTNNVNFGAAVNNGHVEFVNTAAARSKKRAEMLAAADLVANLSELGIDVRNPPDLAKARQTRADEKFRADVQRAQMMLEVFGASLPRFDTEDVRLELSPGMVYKWSSRINFYCKGVPINSSSELGRSKAEAEGRALLAVTAPGGTLEYFVGKKKMDRVRDLIDESPGGHVAGLHVPQLPDEILEPLMDVFGSKEDHEARAKRHAEAKARHERNFLERRQRKSQAKTETDQGAFDELQRLLNEQVEDDEALAFGDLQNGQGPSEGASGQDEVQVLEKMEIDAFQKEEEARAELAEEDPEGRQGKMKAVRDALPIKAIRADLIHALESGQVAVVSGGTGSGKSTQCPQYILENAIADGRGSETRIVVTQPRRIAAISVAERVASERDEDVGNSVGYTVRFNRRAPRGGGASIEFVTTGVLLRRLVNDPSLERISHVMIDEVHERDIDTDFLLVLLRDLLTERPDLRVVLMSATLDAESFGEYFSSGEDSTPVPVLSVPAKPRHPVEVVHLEDMACEAEGTGTPDTGIPIDIQALAGSLLRLHDQQLQLELEEALVEERAASKLEARSIAEDEGGILNMSDDDESSSDSDTDSDSDDQSDEPEYADGLISKSSPLSPSTRIEALRRAVSMRSGTKSHAAVSPQSFSDKREIGEITTRLLAKLAQYVARDEMASGRKGSVLCFLPGLDEIKQAMTILEEETEPSLRDKMKILPLHSTIPQDDQQRVFVPAAEGMVKVILATNIAESSVTIDDVLAVVDGGLVRELNWSAENCMSTMVTVPTSKASATQRLGRAGRVAPGKCYRIYSRGQHEAMPERPMPEIQRTALEATCLNTCTISNDGVAAFLSRAMDPPKEDAVAFSMERLRKLGAINFNSSGESLTPLGRCLSKLPLDPATGRMLVMGCVMQCLDPVLTAAACSGSRNLFYTPPGLREEQRKARQAFSPDSDIMASLRAYEKYQNMLAVEGWDTARQWASDNFISIGALSSVHSTRAQLLNELHRIGLVRNSDLVRHRRRKKELLYDAQVNRNAGIESLFTAVWAGGYPDNLAARRQLGNFGTLRSRTENHAGLHPSAVAFHRKPPKREERRQLPPWFFYGEMVLSSQVFLRDCSALKPEQILLFGGYALDSSNKDDQGKGQRVLDDWIIVEGHCEDTLDVLSTARNEINMALDMKVMNPSRPLPEFQQSAIDSVCDYFELLDEADRTY